jgi:uncharacterized protein YndB with AHSA1/START domain
MFDAPLEMVWKAWTDPEHFMKWWGPAHFTAPVAKMDVRVGGKYHWCMRGPAGTEYNKDFWTAGEFREVVPMRRLVYTDHFADEKGNYMTAKEHGLPGDWPDEQLVTISFEDVGGKTKMTLRHEGLPTGDMSDMTGEGWQGSFDKMEDALTEGRNIIIERTLEAPRALVWKAWTNPEHVAKWWGPNGFTTSTRKMEFKVGGWWVHTMHGPDGTDYPNATRYVTIEEPKRLVYDHGTEEGQPPMFRATVTFEDYGGKTMVTLRSVFPSKEARDQVVREHKAIEGGEQHLARLGEYVAEMKS